MVPVPALIWLGTSIGAQIFLLIGFMCAFVHLHDNEETCLLLLNQHSTCAARANRVILLPISRAEYCEQKAHFYNDTDALEV